MSTENKSDSSTSESEVSACSSNFDPIKALYSDKTKIPVEDAPYYENVGQFEAAQKEAKVIAVGNQRLVKEREDAKRQVQQQKEKELEEFNKRRFSRFEQVTVAPKPRKKGRNVLTRIEAMIGPLATLKECVDQRLRIRVKTRNATGIRGDLHATLVAFDKQWNLALTDVLEIWTKKAPKKRKAPPAMGKEVPKGTAAKIFPVPVVTETPIGKGVWECTRHMPQLFIRGEHVVLVNVFERIKTKNEQFEIANERLEIRNELIAITKRSQIGNLPSEVGKDQSELVNEQSELRNERSEIGNQRSEVTNEQLEVTNINIIVTIKGEPVEIKQELPEMKQEKE